MGIGSKTLGLLTAAANEKKCSLFEALKAQLPEKFKTTPIFRAIYGINQQKEQLILSEILTTLLSHSGYLQLLESKGEQSRLLNITELIEFIKKWEEANPGESLNQMMDRISLDSDTSMNGEPGNNAEDGGKTNAGCPVFLLTMHNAKGLEFPTVIVSGINQTYMPFFMRKEDKAEIEEERRLFYVASTRAIKQLIISIGNEKPSRFLSQIKRPLYSSVFSVEGLFSHLEPENNAPLPEMGIQQETVEEKYLEHPIFGRGKIINVIDRDKFVVDFIKRGEKTIDVSIVPVTFL